MGDKDSNFVRQMWPTAGGGYYWPQATSNNPIPQQSNPSDWAAKAAQWAQQRTVQEQAYHQQQQQAYQQQQQAYQQQQQAYQQQQQQQLVAMAAQQQQAASHQQQYTQTYSQPAPAPSYTPQPLLISQPSQSVQGGPSQPHAPTQGTAYAQMPQQPSPLQANTTELGPGNIESPPKSNQSSYFRGSSYPRGGGFRGHGGHPPRREFQLRDKQEGFRYRGTPRGGMRPRMQRPPAPRGPSPQPYSYRGPGGFMPRQVVQNKYGENSSLEDYSQEGGGVEYHKTQLSENQRGPGIVDKNKQSAEDIEESLYAKAPSPPLVKDTPPSNPPTVVKEYKPPTKLKNQDDEDLYANSGIVSGPTIASLQQSTDNKRGIPGLGELESESFTDTTPTNTATTKDSKPNDNTEKMLASLGKLMTELQGLKGLTSSLQLLKSLPQGKKEEEQDLSEEAKKKAAALLANESDSEGETQSHYRRDNNSSAPQSVYPDELPGDTREFDGYNTHPQQDDYPLDSGRHDETNYRSRDEYPPHYHEGYDREYGYSDLKRPPAEDYYPPSRTSYEGHDSYQEKGAWVDSQDYSHSHIGYDDYPKKYPGKFLSDEGPPMSERYHNGPPMREGRFPTGLPGRERRYPEEEFKRLPPVRDEYSYGGHVPASREDRYRESSRSFSASQIQSFDYGHGGTPAIVDYNHGNRDAVTETTSEQSYRGTDSYPQPLPPTESAFPGFPGMGAFGFSQAMPFLPPGVDPAQAALIAAAYTAQAGEAKRKVLPAWLKEELEKMEAKRQKELQKEQVAQERQSGEGRATWRDEIESDEEEAGKKEEKKGWSKRSYRQQSPLSDSIAKGDQQKPPAVKRKKVEPVPVEDDEEKEVARIMKIRRMLTEILLEVTNQEIDEVTKEVHEEEKRPKLSFALKAPATSTENALAGMSMYNSGSDSDEDENSKSEKSPVVDPLAIAKAFTDTMGSPPSKEHQEWADKLLSNLAPRSRKDSSRKYSKSDSEKHSSSGRRSSQDDYKSSKSSYKKSSREKEKESSSSKKSSSRGHSRFSDSPISSKRSLSGRRSHSPPPASGMSLSAGFLQSRAVSKSIRGRSPSPSAKKRSRRSRSRSYSPGGKHQSSHRKDGRSKSPKRSAVSDYRIVTARK